jgi:predicted ATP-dependent endonuclease of OLD family
MILKSVHVLDYKSITDSEEVRVEADVTCLVGKNESGKTAFLEPLYRLNPVPSGYKTDFEELYDYPRARRARDKARIPTATPIVATFELEDADVAAVEEHWSGVFRSRTVTITKDYSNERAWTLDLNPQGAGAHSAESAATAEPEPGTEEVDDAETTLAQEVGQEAEGGLDVDLETEIVNILEPRLPHFLYFDEYANLPGRVSISYLQATTPEDLDADDRTALSLLRLADVATDEFSEEHYEARRAALEAASSEITSELFEFWSQNRNLRVFFDVDFTGEADEDGREPPFLEIRIDNLRHHVTLNFGERSRGFVWFFSFLAAFSEYRYREKLIILLDEPGLGLHAAAQNDLMRYIEERLAQQHQVIYSTHSPFMVDPTRLDRVRTVEDRDDEGTKVGEDVLGTTPDTLFPLQAALGYELAHTLFVGPDNLVVEGPADFVYLMVLSEHLAARTDVA